MLTNFILPMFVAINTTVPSSSELQAAASPNLIKWASENQVILVAQRGPEHGPDPRAEQRDWGLPANRDRFKGSPNPDPYDGTTPHNHWNPYQPTPLPIRPFPH